VPPAPYAARICGVEPVLLERAGAIATVTLNNPARLNALDKATWQALGRAMTSLGPADRVTPAGRFLANLDRDARGKQVLLIDYDNAIALHPVVAGTVAERRAERLASPSPEDNRISFGCINVSADFFRDIVSAVFARTDGYVYILPESAGPSAMSVAPQ